MFHLKTLVRFSLLAFLLIFTLSGLQSQGTFDGCANEMMVQIECEALVALYNGMNGPNWEFKHGWLQTDPCNWYGVVCGPGGHVQSLMLMYNRLSGLLPSQIGNLSELRKLDLSGNELEMLPIEIGNLSQLRELYFSNNKIADLPATINNLSWLTDLHLNGNRLGSLPMNLNNLIRLKTLYLQENGLVMLGGLFDNQLDDLTVIDLSHNRLDFIPNTIERMPTVQKIYLNYNRLTSLPATIANLQNLTHLEIHSNRLTSLPTQLQNLNIQFLNLRNNSFSEFPPLQNMDSLVQLLISGNMLKSIPSWVNPTTFPNLSSIYLSENSLVITDPTIMSFLETVSPGWQSRQIVAPGNFHVKNYNTTTSEITFGWTPIALNFTTGEYIVGCGSTPATPFDRYVVSTFDEDDSEIKMLGLAQGMYYCAIKTQNEYNAANFNIFTSDPSASIEVNITTPPTVINDAPQDALPINQTQYGYFLGEFNQATDEATVMPIPTNCGVTPDLKSVYFEIPRSQTGTRAPGRYVIGRTTIISGGPGYFISDSSEHADTIMAVYRYLDVGSWELLQCNDDFSVDGASQLDFVVDPLMRYRIVVWGKTGASLESLIMQSTVPNMTNSGVEINVDSEPNLPDGWTIIDDLAPGYNVIQCHPGSAYSGGCYAAFYKANWQGVRIPVSSLLSQSLKAGDKIRYSFYIQRQQLSVKDGGPGFRLSSPSWSSPLISLEPGHDDQYWKLVSSTFTVPEPVNELYLEIYTHLIRDGSINIDEVAIEVQFDPANIPPTETPNSPTATLTPSNMTATPDAATPTFTPLPEGSTQLLANRGFEINDVAPLSQPDMWSPLHSTKDRVKCNTETVQFAYEGFCAYRFVGSTMEKAVLSQKIASFAPLFAAGDSLSLSLRYKTNKATPKLKVKMVVTYADPTITPEKVKGVINTSTLDYTPFSLSSYTLLNGNVSRIKVQFQNRSRSGKLYLDDINLVYTSQR